MTRTLLVLSLCSSALPACMIVPAKKVTTGPANTEYGARTFAKTHAVELATRADRGTLHVHAIRRGECTRPVYAITEVKTEKQAKLGGPDDPRAKVFGAVLAPVLIPISAVITGFIVAADSPQIRMDTLTVGTQHYGCSEVAGELAIDLTLPSGATLRGVTDEAGDLEVDVPSTEPHTGAVRVAAARAEAREVSYARPRPAYSVTRDAVTECATRFGITGAVELKLAVSDSGRATRLWLSQGDSQFNSCVSQRVAGVEFPDKAHAKTIKLALSL
jgi:hypothetical protein